MSKKIILLLIIVPLFVAGCTGGGDLAPEKPVAVGVSNEGIQQDGFLGDRGETLEAEAGRILVAEAQVDDGNMHSFNYFSKAKNKTIYFFVVKASDGTYRVAANACEVCYGAKKGFSQTGNLIRCNNCGTTYSKDKIALEKGGCNPSPISADAEVIDGNLIIAVQAVEAVANLF